MTFTADCFLAGGLPRDFVKAGGDKDGHFGFGVVAFFDEESEVAESIDENLFIVR